MCKSAAQGGQRCPSSARARVAAATAALAAAQQACADLDSNPPDRSTPELEQAARALRRATFDARRDAEDALQQAKVVYASTTEGEAEYQSQIDAIVADESLPFVEACNREMELAVILMRGRELRHVNEVVESAARHLRGAD